LTLDFNYTLSHSLDNAPDCKVRLQFANASFIRESSPAQQFLRQLFVRRSSQHQRGCGVELPFGKEQASWRCSKLAQALVEGGTFRYFRGTRDFDSRPFDSAQWATNFQVQAGVTPLSPVHTCRIVRKLEPQGVRGCDVTAIYQNFRSAYPAKSVLGIPSAIRLYRYGSAG